MQTRNKPENSQITQIFLNANRLATRKHNAAANLRVLPMLKNYSNDEPINFKLYERAKRNKRIQMIRPPQEQNFFLEGEFFCTVKSDIKPLNQKNKIIEVASIPPLERQHISRILKKQISSKPASNHNKQQTIKLYQSQHKKKVCPRSPIQHKTPYIYNTLQSNLKPQPSPKPKPHPLPNNTSNHSLTSLAPPEPDKQKQLIHFDKKQLLKIKAESFIILEHPTLKILTGNRYKNPAEIASLTKIMTFYTVHRLAAHLQLDLATQLATVCELASDMSGTSAELVVGDTLTVEQLLYGLMLPSGNDAAVALAEWGGSLLPTLPDELPLNAFVKMMNKNSKQLELKQSSFGNPHGLPDFRNTSTPYDLALLIAACMEIPLFCKIISTQVYKLWVHNEGGKKELIWQNTNKLLRREGFIGVKTGVTVTAGPCLASCYQSGNKKFIVVLLRTNKLSRRFKETRLILGWTLRKYNSELYGDETKKILKNDAVLDSDNSQDQQEFSYACLDAAEITKRNKILLNQL